MRNTLRQSPTSIECNNEPGGAIGREKPPGAVVIGGNFQGLGVLRSLARRKVPTYLLDWQWCIGRFSRYAKRASRCPDISQETAFLEFLIDLARKENLMGWVVYPNDDETVCLLAKHWRSLGKYYRLLTPPWDVVKFAYDKRMTYELAGRCDIAIPRTFYPASMEELKELPLQYPVILKPSVKDPFYSRTRKKAIRVDRKENLVSEFMSVRHAIGSGQVLMVQELIPGSAESLFSVGSLSRGGKLLARVVARRPRQHPMDFGHATTYAETVDIPELEEIAGKILGAMGYSGLSEVEFMLDPRDGKYKLIEINVRPWGWHTLAIGAGVDLPYLAYLDILGEEVAHKNFDVGVKWMRLITDVPTVLIELLKRRMSLGHYLKTLKGRKEEAVLSMRDPAPFLAEIIMLPYLWKKRGF